MPDKKLRAGVIGCGQGAYHAYAYEHAIEFELISVCDLTARARGASSWLYSVLAGRS